MHYNTSCARNLSGLGLVSCKSIAAAAFLPSSWLIDGLVYQSMGQKNHSLGSSSLLTPKTRLSRVAKALSLLGWVGFAMPTLANPYFLDIGPSLTLGSGLNRANLQSAINNPANSNYLIGPDESFRISYLSAGGRYELGAVNDVWRASKDLQRVIDDAVGDGSAAAVKAAANRVETDFLPLLEKSARGSLQAQGGILSPVLWRSDSIPGVFSLALDAGSHAGSSVVTDNATVLIKFSSKDSKVDGSRLHISINGLADQLELLKGVKNSADQYAALGNLASQVSADEQEVLRTLLDSTLAGNTVDTSLAVTSATAFDMRIAAVARASLGYALDLTPLLPGLAKSLGSDGKIGIGLRAIALQAMMYRQTVALVDKDGNSTILDLSETAKSKNVISAGTLDLGVNYVAPTYQLGLTAYNLIPVRLRYPNPLRDPNLTNANAAVRLAKIGKIKSDEIVELQTQGVFEAAFFTPDRTWGFQMASALNKAVDFVGQPIQPASVALSYNSDYRQKEWPHWLAPSLRLGYHKNLAGSKLNGVAFGCGFGPLNLDIYSSVNQLKMDGKSIPQTFGLSLTFAEVF